MKAVSASVGYAADERGNGVAYVRMSVKEGGPRVLRVAFRVQRQPALSGREVGYAALTAVCGSLRRRGLDFVRFAVDPGPFLQFTGSRRDRLDLMLMKPADLDAAFPFHLARLQRQRAGSHLCKRRPAGAVATEQPRNRPGNQRERDSGDRGAGLVGEVGRDRDDQSEGADEEDRPGWGAVLAQLAPQPVTEITDRGFAVSMFASKRTSPFSGR